MGVFCQTLAWQRTIMSLHRRESVVLHSTHIRWKNVVPYLNVWTILQHVDPNQCHWVLKRLPWVVRWVHGRRIHPWKQPAVFRPYALVSTGINFHKAFPESYDQKVSHLLRSNVPSNCFIRFPQALHRLLLRLNMVFRICVFSMGFIHIWTDISLVYSRAGLRRSLPKLRLLGRCIFTCWHGLQSYGHDNPY